MDMDKALDKIKKLLALSKSPNEHEAHAAMLKAQELMSQYSINVETVTESEVEYLKIAGDDGQDTSFFRIPLASILSNNFRCKIFLRDNAIYFYGHSDDCKICKEVYQFAYKHIKRLSSKRYNEFRKCGKPTKGFYTNYQTAFLIQLKNKFSEQCKALMIVTPQDVEDKFNEMTGDWNIYRKGFKNNKANTYAYNQGCKDGKSFANNNLNNL